MSGSFIMLFILGGILIVAFLVFFMSSKKHSSGTKDLDIGTPPRTETKDIKIEVKSAVEDTVEVVRPSGARTATLETTPVAQPAPSRARESQKPAPAPSPEEPPVTQDDTASDPNSMFGIEYDLASSGLKKTDSEVEESSKDFGELMHGSSAGFEYETEKTASADKPKAVRPEEIVFSFDENEAPISTITEIAIETDDIFNIEDDAPIATPSVKVDLPPVTEPLAPEPKKMDIPSEDLIESILDQRAATLKTQTAAPIAHRVEQPVTVSESAIPAAEMDPEEEKAHEKARRIARVIINDIRNYNPDKLAEGIRIGNIMKTLGAEVEMGRQLYVKRVPPEIARNTNYYRENLIKILADGRADLLGF